jgi:predicted metal-dependent hydrolase
MNAAADEYDPLYLQGIAYFNVCEFFEAHEVWEELWKNYSGDLRLFYKGLIQAAVALHHFGNGNTRGARKVYGTSRGYLEPYVPTWRNSTRVLPRLWRVLKSSRRWS